MKILLISNMYPSDKSPFFGTFVKNFKTQLENEGYKFNIVAIKGRGNSKIEKLKKYLTFSIDTIKKIRQHDYDLIYVHYISHSLIPLIFVKSLIKKPLVINAHGSDVFVNNKLGFLLQKLVIPVIKKSDMIVVPSIYFKKIIAQKFDLCEKKIFVSPSGGIDTSLFTPTNNSLNQSIVTLGYVSRIDKGKGWDILLDAISILKKKNFLFKVLVIGGGQEEPALKERIKQLNLENTIEYLGAKPHNELTNYFNKMDIFIFPSLRKAESLGLVGLEAMACGLPVIGSNIGGLPSYIFDEKNGKLFEPGNSKELAKKIEDFLIMDQNTFFQYKKEALNTSKKYDSKIVAQNLSNKLKELINDSE